MPSGGTCTIGRLAARSGVKVETIRYYERIGLVRQPPRSAGGHRLYTDADVHRLVFIRRSRELGFSLEAVRTLLGPVDGGHTCAEVRAVAAEHLTDIRRKIADLRRMERTLADMVEQCERGDTPGCPIVDSLSTES